ncbi:hypothetical protein [Helicobacter canadensis]|nr:hypothetical protein [Helicobacter canadensis]
MLKITKLIIKHPQTYTKTYTNLKFTILKYLYFILLPSNTQLTHY